MEWVKLVLLVSGIFAAVIIFYVNIFVPKGEDRKNPLILEEDERG